MEILFTPAPLYIATMKFDKNAGLLSVSNSDCIPYFVTQGFKTMRATVMAFVLYVGTALVS